MSPAQVLSSGRITVPREAVSGFCRKHHIRRLALFGSVLRDDFRPDSDVDVLVEFEPSHVPGFIRMAAMENELSALFERKVDLLTPGSISHYFREKVLREALTLHDAA
jgi:predicted nucleotidyltransferase